MKKTRESSVGIGFDNSCPLMSSALVKAMLAFQSLTSIRFAYIEGNHHHAKCFSIIAKLKLEVDYLKFYKDAELKTEKFECKFNVSVLTTNTASN